MLCFLCPDIIYVQIEVLIMLDGSPEYVECQTRYARHQASAVASPELQAAVVESHFLLAFIVMYRPIQYHDLVLASLRQYSTQEERVEAAVAVTMGIGDIRLVVFGGALKTGLKTLILSVYDLIKCIVC